MAKEGTKVPKVPESVLKKRKQNEKLAAERVAIQKKLRLYKKAKKEKVFQRAEKYVKEYRETEKSLIGFRRQAKKDNTFFVEPEAKVAFVIRIKGIIGVDPKTRKILQLLRLLQINNGVFIRLNKASINMLKVVQPYVAFGYPTVKTVKELIYKRGYLKIDRQRVPITDNMMIEKSLGHLDIVCVEDMIHEIVTCGPHFKEVNKFLWPFKLNCPRGGFLRKRNHFVEGGDFGNREEKINELIAQMN